MDGSDFNVEKGMEVYGSDEQRIGTVVDVWSVDAYRHGRLDGHYPTQGEDTGETGVHETDKTDFGAIFQVNGNGVGSPSALYVPYGAIKDMADGRVTLCYSAAESNDLFSSMPHFLETTLAHQGA